MIIAQHLTKSFRRKVVLRDLSFTAPPGELTLIVGPNGAGKTTTLRILAGLARPDAGTAFISGRHIVRETRQAQAHLSFLPQAANFHPRLTCGQIIDFYARLRGVTSLSREAVLDRTGLSECANEQTRVLSGGMRQRLALAVLLLPGADVLLLDEPGLSLDPIWRRRLQAILEDEARGGRTVLVTTHLIAEWNGVADRALLFRDGLIDRELDPSDLEAAFEERQRDEPGSRLGTGCCRTKDSLCQRCTSAS